MKDQERQHKEENARRPAWWDVLLRTKKEAAEDNLTVVAAGVGFFVLLGLIPGLVVVISICGLVVDPVVVQQQLDTWGTMVPIEAREILQNEIGRISEASGLVGFGALFGLLLVLWSGSKAMKALIQAFNIVYDELERRSFIHFNLLALGMTLGAVLVALVAIGAIVALPIVLGLAGLDESSRRLIAWARWPLLIGIFMTGLALLYRYAPNRPPPRWKWITWGSILATVLWIAGSALFSFYVSNFANYNKTYGSLGAVVILLMWFYLTAFVVLLGAELNSEIEARATAHRERATGSSDRSNAEGTPSFSHAR